VRDDRLELPLALLRHCQSAARVQHRVEPLEHRILGQRDLVDEEEVAAAHRRHERPVYPHKQRGRRAQLVGQRFGLV